MTNSIETKTNNNVLESFRKAMRRHLGGVAIITTRDQGIDFGIVITAVISLSMDPPSILVSVNKDASVTKPIFDRGEFCVNILSEDQEAFCREFAKSKFEDRFASPLWRRSEAGIPYLPQSQANLFCTLASNMEFGTHKLIAGAIIDAIVRDDVAPLAYVDGQYVAGRAIEANN